MAHWSHSQWRFVFRWDESLSPVTHRPLKWFQLLSYCAVSGFPTQIWNTTADMRPLVFSKWRMTRLAQNAQMKQIVHRQKGAFNAAEMCWRVLSNNLRPRAQKSHHFSILPFTRQVAWFLSVETGHKIYESKRINKIYTAVKRVETF